jgi:hypothetical protein
LQVGGRFAAEKRRKKPGTRRDRVPGRWRNGLLDFRPVRSGAGFRPERAGGCVQERAGFHFHAPGGRGVAWLRSSVSVRFDFKGFLEAELGLLLLSLGFQFNGFFKPLFGGFGGFHNSPVLGVRSWMEGK